MLERRVTNLERWTVGGHATLVRLFAHVRAVAEGRPAPPLCGCPPCVAMVRELCEKARVWRAGGDREPDATH